MVEKASIDEAFIDFTQPVREELLKRYPHLATVPPDAPNGADTPLPPPPAISWDGVGNLVPVHPDSAQEEESEVKREGSVSLDAAPVTDSAASALSQAVEETAVEDDDEPLTWHDVALSIGAELMMRIREDIRSKLGYTTSAVSVIYYSASSSALRGYYRVWRETSSSRRCHPLSCDDDGYVLTLPNVSSSRRHIRNQ